MSKDFYNDEEGYETPAVPQFWAILGKCIKFTFIALIVLINAFLLWRVFFSTNEPSAIKTVAGNAALAEAWESFGGEDFALYQAGQDNIGTNEKWRYPIEPPEGELKNNDYAQFFLTDVVFFPNAAQTQVVLRYNKSALKILAKDYGLEDIPAKGEDVFDVTLVVYYKPDTDSAEKSMRIKAQVAESENTSLYSFRQLVFEGMPAFSSISSMNVEIYYKGDADYTKAPYSLIDLYDVNLGTRPYQLDKKDIAAIEAGK